MIIGGKSFILQTWLEFNENFLCRHNELDLPGLTSPLMYEKIAARKSVPQLYEEKLIVSKFFLGTSFPNIYYKWLALVGKYTHRKRCLLHSWFLQSST